MPSYTVTVTGPSVVDGCACHDWEPCGSCQAIAYDLIGKRVADAASGNREFVVADDDTKDGRVTVAGEFFWAYLDDVRPVVSHQEVDTLDQAREDAVEIVLNVWDRDGEEGVLGEYQGPLDAARALPVGGDEIELPNGVTITVKPVEDDGGVSC
jgi:hypothetical protein